MTKWIAYFDGACPGNHPCFGAVLVTEDGKGPAFRRNGPVPLIGGHRTVNVAEYGGLLAALELAEEHAKAGDSLLVQGDSQLVVRQVLGEYRIKEPHLRPYANRATAVIARMRAKGVSVELKWVPREQNMEADMLSKAVSP